MRSEHDNRAGKSAAHGLRVTVTDGIGDLAGNADAAIVCVLLRYHLPVTRELLDMDLHGPCEKPVAIASTDAAEMGRSLPGARIVSLPSDIGKCARRTCGSSAISWALDFLGEILSIVAEFGNVLEWPMSSGAYFDGNVTAGGVMFEAGIHVMDLAVWLRGGIHHIEYEKLLRRRGKQRRRRGTGQHKGSPCSAPCLWSRVGHTQLNNGIACSAARVRAEARFTLRDELVVRQSA